ncbi:helix-turn-helix transcriptional regulator [Virgibacillus sp. W0430]|uniref:helix-turn-helix transcriptional regulator n=1 Tax=Virgibacillus sp. W0430 TaxID=3391580 RepID=UPI003F48BD67
MNKKELNRILVDARNEKKLTHEQVALYASDYLPEDKTISRQYYGMIENVVRVPSVDVAKSVAKVLDVNWTIFFEVECNQTLQKQAI